MESPWQEGITRLRVDKNFFVVYLLYKAFAVDTINLESTLNIYISIKTLMCKIHAILTGGKKETNQQFVRGIMV